MYYSCWKICTNEYVKQYCNFYPNRSLKLVCQIDLHIPKNIYIYIDIDIYIDIST